MYAPPPVQAHQRRPNAGAETTPTCAAAAPPAATLFLPQQSNLPIDTLRACLAYPALDAVFLAWGEAAGLTNLKGHRSVGGMRASIYNAMDMDGVAALIDYMTEFERTKA